MTDLLWSGFVHSNCNTKAGEDGNTTTPHREKIFNLDFGILHWMQNLPVDGSYEVSLLEPFKANVYIESIQDLKEADY